jgi:hypothetical protein
MFRKTVFLSLLLITVSVLSCKKRSKVGTSSQDAATLRMTGTSSSVASPIPGTLDINSLNLAGTNSSTHTNTHTNTSTPKKIKSSAP